MEIISLVNMAMMLGMFFTGFLSGVLSKGINITIKHKQETAAPIPQEPMKYNESTANELPQDIKDYFIENKGFVK